MKLNEGDVNFIKVETISAEGHLIPSKIQKIDHTTHLNLRRSRLEEGDILYSIAGSIGRSVIVAKDDLPANINQAIALLRPKSELVDTDYLFYYLRNSSSQKDASRRIVQSKTI
jgi:type I restriction enzyme S subunit